MITPKVNNDGFEGVLYPGDGSKEKVLIVMSGSNGGMSIAKRAATEEHIRELEREERAGDRLEVVFKAGVSVIVEA